MRGKHLPGALFPFGELGGRRRRGGQLRHDILERHAPLGSQLGKALPGLPGDLDARVVSHRQNSTNGRVVMILPWKV